jgi:hypothetical protein
MATKKTWQQRQAEHKKAAVLEILRRPAGESENEAIPRVAAKYNGRNLPKRKHLKLSPATLRRIWYNWKKEPSDAVFDLHFAEAVNQSVIQLWVIHLFTAYAVIMERASIKPTGHGKRQIPICHSHCAPCSAICPPPTGRGSPRCSRCGIKLTISKRN